MLAKIEAMIEAICIRVVYDYKHFIIIYFISWVWRQEDTRRPLNRSHLKRKLKGRYEPAFEGGYKFGNTLLVFMQNVSADSLELLAIVR